MGMTDFKRLALAVSKAIFVYGLLAWLYVVAIVLNPLTAPSQTWPLSYYVPIPTNFFGVSGFAISFIAFILWEWKRQR